MCRRYLQCSLFYSDLTYPSGFLDLKIRQEQPICNLCRNTEYSKLSITYDGGECSDSWPMAQWKLFYTHNCSVVGKHLHPFYPQTPVITVVHYAAKESSRSADEQCRRLRARQVQPQDGLCRPTERGQEFAVQPHDGAERCGRKLPILHHRAKWSPLHRSRSKICMFLPFLDFCVRFSTWWILPFPGEALSIFGHFKYDEPLANGR